jgi:hypothetical protein
MESKLKKLHTRTWISIDLKWSGLLLSEEISSRVAESTRLILVKDGFGGDLGALDRWSDERRKDAGI